MPPSGKFLQSHFLIVYVIILRKFRRFPDSSDLRKSRDSRLEKVLAYILILSEKVNKRVMHGAVFTPLTALLMDW